MSFNYSLLVRDPLKDSRPNSSTPVQGDSPKGKEPESSERQSEYPDNELETRQEQQIRLTREYILEMASSSSNVVGVHYRVGKKIGEGSFGVIFEGTNLLNNQQVAIKFVRIKSGICLWHVLTQTGTTEERCTTVTRRVSYLQNTCRLP